MAQSFSTSALGGGEWSASRPGRFIPGTHCIGDTVGPKSRSGRCGEERNLLPLSVIESRPSSPYPAVIPTELFWLLPKYVYIASIFRAEEEMKQET
jgi:hypothetical protein